MPAILLNVENKFQLIRRLKTGKIETEVFPVGKYKSPYMFLITEYPGTEPIEPLSGWETSLVRFFRMGKKVTISPKVGGWEISCGNQKIFVNAVHAQLENIVNVLNRIELPFDLSQEVTTYSVAERLHPPSCDICGKPAEFSLREGCDYTKISGNSGRIYPTKFYCEHHFREASADKNLRWTTTRENVAEPCSSPAGKIGFFSVEEANKRRHKLGGHTHRGTSLAPIGGEDVEDL